MELLDHTLWVRELSGRKLPTAVVVAPEIIDHDDSRREAVIYYPIGVLHHVALILLVYQLDPSVPLGHTEELLRGHLPKGEGLPGQILLGVTQVGTRSVHMYRPPCDHHHGVPLNLEVEGLLTPQGPSAGGDEGRRNLVWAVQIDQIQPVIVTCGEGVTRPVHDAASVPVLPVFNLEGAWGREPAPQVLNHRTVMVGTTFPIFCFHLFCQLHRRRHLSRTVPHKPGRPDIVGENAAEEPTYNVWHDAGADDLQAGDGCLAVLAFCAQLQGR